MLDTRNSGPVSSRPAEQWNECNRPQRLPLDALLLARKAYELLFAFGTHRNQQTSTYFQLLDQRFGHASYYVGLRNSLAKTYWQCGVFVRAAAQRLVDKYMTWHIPNTIQHRKVRDALVTKPLHQTIPRARGCHPYTSKSNVNH